MEDIRLKEEALAEAVGGKWSFDTLNEEEKRRFCEVNEGLSRDWNYLAYNAFIEEMNAKYGAN